MFYEKIGIIGCGSLGASLAFWISILQKENAICQKLILMDADSITHLPYLINSSPKILGKSKVIILKNIIQNIDSPLEIEIYQKLYFDINPEKCFINALTIDCRDSTSCNLQIDVKLHYDGDTGYVIFNPGIHETSIESPYQYGQSNFNALRIAGDMLDLILTSDINKEAQYVIRRHNNSA